MKNWSGHIIFDEKFQWKDLEKPFPEIWEIISSRTKQNSEEIQYDQLDLYQNMEEIKNNKKPFGYIREGSRYRLLFPAERKEMIVFRGILSEDLRDVVDEITRVLRAKKVKFTVEWDKMLLYEIRSRRK